MCRYCRSHKQSVLVHAVGLSFSKIIQNNLTETNQVATNHLYYLPDLAREFSHPNLHEHRRSETAASYVRGCDTACGPVPRIIAIYGEIMEISQCLRGMCCRRISQETSSEFL